MPGSYAICVYNEHFYIKPVSVLIVGVKSIYILLAGLWCSVRKPPSFGFLEPVCEQLKELESKGVNIHCVILS